MIYVATDETGRVTAATDREEYAVGMTGVGEPEGFDWSHVGDWVLDGGALSRDGAQTAAEEAAREEAEAQAERRAAIDAGAAEFFADGGKQAMEQSIRDAAASGGADPQVAVLARLLAPTIDFASVTATDVVAIPDYIPAWEDVSHFEQNDPCTYDGTIYRASRAHDRQDIYPPDVAGESMYYPIEVAPDGIIVYRTCHGEYDMVREGEKRHYPDADGPVYRALDDTAYSPDTYPAHWELVEGGGA